MMGKLTYGALQREIVMGDVLLAHVEVVVLSRLRRNNAFALRWTETVEGRSDVRRTIWIHQGADLYFEYDTAEQGELDRDMLDRLAKAADSNTGINLRFDASDAVWVDEN
jgi:hypothetical protein